MSAINVTNEIALIDSLIYKKLEQMQGLTVQHNAGRILDLFKATNQLGIRKANLQRRRRSPSSPVYDHEC
jgi:hypothetical protein